MIKIGNNPLFEGSDTRNAISDTTPIISLLKANPLELLQRLYGNVLIPKAVRENTQKERAFKLI